MNPDQSHIQTDATATMSGSASGGTSKPLAIIFTLPEAPQAPVYEEFYTLGTIPISDDDTRDGDLLFSQPQPQDPVRAAELSVYPGAVLYAEHALILAHILVGLPPGGGTKQSLSAPLIASIRCWSSECEDVCHYWLDTMTIAREVGGLWLEFTGFGKGWMPVARVRMTPHLLSMVESASHP